MKDNPSTWGQRSLGQGASQFATSNHHLHNFPLLRICIQPHPAQPHALSHLPGCSLLLQTPSRPHTHAAPRHHHQAGLPAARGGCSAVKFLCSRKGERGGTKL